jgi:hypothetical protein
VVFPPSSTAGKEWEKKASMNLEKIIDRSFDRVKAFKSYRCVMDLYSWKNSREKSQQRFLYRAPGDVRIEQIGAWKKGAVVVMRSNGKIRARGGGLLSFMKLELGKDSDLLRGITGDSAVECDWESVLGKFKRMLPFVVKAECQLARVSSFSGYEVVAHVKGQPFDQARVILREDGPILRLDRFRDSQIESRSEWNHIEIDIEAGDEDFDL